MIPESIWGTGKHAAENIAFVNALHTVELSLPKWLIVFLPLVAALESNVPEDELIEVILENDELKIDGNLAVCWSSNLEFTVERSTKTLVGSAVSGEGLVNVYRGTGRVLMCPVAPTASLFESTNTMAAKAAAKSSNTFGK